MSDVKLVTAVDAENPIWHDIEVRDGQIIWVGLDPYDEGEQALMIAQRVACRLLFIQGEWYLNQLEGTPWRTLWAKGCSAAKMERIFRAVIEGTPGIRSVTQMTVSVDHETRTATVTWSAIGDAGEQIGPETVDTPFVIGAT